MRFLGDALLYGVAAWVSWHVTIAVCSLFGGGS